MKKVKKFLKNLTNVLGQALTLFGLVGKLVDVGASVLSVFGVGKKRKKK